MASAPSRPAVPTTTTPPHGTPATSVEAPRDPFAVRAPTDAGSRPAPPAHPDWVARSFAEAYLSYAFSEAPDAGARRAAPYATPALAAALLPTREAGAWADIVARRERAVARVLTTYGEGADALSRELTVVAVVVVSSSAGTTERRPVLTLSLRLGAGGWLVAAVTR